MNFKGITTPAPHVKLIALLLILMGFAWTPAAFAFPPVCKPAPGATRDCAAKQELPWIYTHVTCNSAQPRTSESAALQDFINEQMSPAQNVCGLQVQRVGWLTAPGMVWGCGTISQYPGSQNGIETDNASIYNFQWTHCVTQQPMQEQGGGPVRRSRSLECPAGYTGDFNNSWVEGYCQKGTNEKLEDKNRGGQCPSCGNPITVGVGNKYQKEDDYRGIGPFPLEFNRYYNSLMKGVGYSLNNYLGGPETRAGLASAVDDLKGYAVSRDQVGLNWRHSYQRAIISTTSWAMETARVYRADGRVLMFNNYNGAFVSDEDVSDRLEKFADGSWRYTTAPDNQVESYNPAGKLLSIRDRNGLMQTLSYDSCGLLTAVADSFGKAITFAYSVPCSGVSGTPYRLASVTDPAGKTYAYAYDGLGRLTDVTAPDLSVRHYHYENAQFIEGLTGITDESAQRFATWTYDANLRADSSEHANGAERSSIVYQPLSPCAWCPPGTVSTASVTDSAGAVRSYGFGIVLGVAKPTSINQPAANGVGTVTQSFSYDANGNTSSKTDFNGNITTYGFDLVRNLETSRTEAYGTPRTRTITTQWHPTYRLPTQIDEPGRRTTFTHDPNGNVLTRTVLDTATSVSRTWTYTYNTAGQVLTMDGPRTDANDMTTYTYYTCTTGAECGQVHTITNAAQHVTTFNTYNANSQPLTMTDANGVVTTLTYDSRHRLKTRTVNAEQTVFDYWPIGAIKKVTLPDGSYLSYSYDAAHRLTQIQDGEGNKVVYTSDAMGNRTKEESFDASNALTQTRTRVFNQLNQLYQDLAAAGTANVTTTFGYDNNGNQTTIAAPMARNSSSGFDELNRLTTTTDPLSGVTSYGYNALDQLLSVTDPRNFQTTYTYNALGDLKTQVSPDTGTTTNTYDSGGNLKTTTDARNLTATYTYDALNRVTQTSYPDQTLTFSYDTGANAVGKLSSLSDASGSTSWTYTPEGRINSKTQLMGSVSKTANYGYNTAGQLTTLTTPSGKTVAYGYRNNHITSITVNGIPLVNNVLYEPFGPTSGWTWGNGSLAVRIYDTDGKLTQLDSAGLNTYQYDDAFRITGITDTSIAANSQTFGYDLLDRLTSGSKVGQNQTFTYDANGNRQTQGGTTSSTFTNATTSNRLNAVTGALTKTYVYDTAGNTTSDGTITYIYNNAGRMTSATKAGVTTTYTYNALGQRVTKTTAGVTTYFVYDEAGHILGEYDSTGALIEEIVWLNDTPVATIRWGSCGMAIFYIHTDHLNTPRKITKRSTPDVVWRWDSDAFGTTQANENPGGLGMFAFNLRFPGQYFDSETGLMYNGYRDFDAATGRYVESDPIGLKGGINTYGYAGANPISNVDPTGLAIWICTRKVSGFPFTGNHGYLWNDLNRTSCGMQGSFGVGPLGRKEKGPSVDTCVLVPGSDGKESDVMKCCENNANNGLWTPGINDCHNAAKDCIKDNNLITPPYPGRDGALRGERRCTRAGCITYKW